MSLKRKGERYTNMADKLNSKEELNDEVFSEEDKKFIFFWKKCMLESIDTSSIIEKVQLKIKRNKIKRRRLVLSSFSVAASIIIFVLTFHFVQNSKINEEEVNIKEMVAKMEKIDIKSIKSVTLMTSQNQVTLNGDAAIKYTKAGEIVFDSQEVDKIVENNSDGYDYLVVPAGKQAHLELADGTKLIINSESKVLYPRYFKGTYRTVFINGEAYMDVMHDKTHPFIVSSNNFNLRVLGTKFNVSTYKGMESVVLVRGSVEVVDKYSHKAKLFPNEMLRLKKGMISDLQKVNVDEYISWIDGLLVLKDSYLSAVVRKLSISYGVPIHCSERVKNKKIYGKLDLKSNLDKVLECIQQTIPMKIEKTDAGIFLK